MDPQTAPIAPSHDPSIEPPALIPQYLPGGQAHFLSGPPGGGKTAFVAGLVAAVQAGRPIFGKACNPPPLIGLISADRRWSDSRQWYDVAGVGQLPYFSIVDSDIPIKDLRKPDYPLILLDRLVTEHFHAPPNSLIIIDPISYWAGGDMNRYMQVYMAMIGLNRFCEKHQITVLGLAHTGKQKGDVKERYTRPQDRINGSTALLGNSGTQMALETPDQTDSPYYRFTWVAHHAPPESYTLERTENGLFREIDIPSSTIVPRPEILTLIPTAPQPSIAPKQLLGLCVAKHCEVSRKTLFRCLRLWHDAGLIYQPAEGEYLRTSPQ